MEIDHEKLQWLTFDLLEPYSHLLQRVYLRHGGASRSPYGTLNLAEGIGDHPDSVKVNRDLVSKSLNLSHVVYPRQSHGVSVVEVTLDNHLQAPEADALFTKEKDIGLAITHADCQAAIFYDPKQEVIGVAHAGWRGSVQNIYKKMVETLSSEAGCRPKDLIVCISPSLCPEHAEFKNYKKELPEEFWSFQTTPNHFDFWAIAKKQLTECGVGEDNIEIPSICTYCDEKDYYSHRREKKTGRHATIVGLKK